MRRLCILAALAAPTAARAAFWDQPARLGITGGVSVIVALGADPDRSRVGFGLDAGYQRFWQDGAYYRDGPLVVAPLVTVAAHVGWTKPFVFAEVTAAAGPMYPLFVADGGFMPLIGAQVGAGLGISTDGWAGPVFVGGVLAPFVEARVEASRRDGAWYAPRLAVGPTLPLNCCGYYD